MVKDSLYAVHGLKNNGETEIIVEHVTFEKAISFIKDGHRDYLHHNIIEEKEIKPIPKNLFVVSNTESLLEETKELLNRAVKLKETFVFLGNFIGENNFAIYMKYLINLKKRRPCVFVLGRNEYNLLEYINGSDNYIGDRHQIDKMIDSIERELGYCLKRLPNRFPEAYKLLNECVDYYENDRYIFTPGGLDLSINYWKLSDKESLLTTTDDFLIHPNTTGKKIVFGDKTTSELSEDSSIYGLWKNINHDKIGINGNCSGHGKLIGFSILGNEINYFTVRSHSGRLSRKLARKQDIPDEVPEDENEWDWTF